MRRTGSRLWNRAGSLQRALITAAAVSGAVGFMTFVAPAAVHAQRDGDRDTDRDRDRDGGGEERETATPIQHLVVIFQENVSFDHYFATYPNATNVDGSVFKAKAGTPLVNGLFPGGLLDHNPNSTQPFRLGFADAATCDQDHNYPDEQRAFDAGLMDKFPETVGVGGAPATCNDAGKKKGLVMGYFDGNTVTALWNYAQNFAMNDNSYSTTFGPSTPGALNLVAGQTWGARVVADAFNHFGNPSGNVTAIAPDGVGADIGDPRPGPALDNCTIPSDPVRTRTYIEMSGRNIGDLLNARGVTWGWFQGGFRPAPSTALPPSSSTPGGTGPVVCGSAHGGVPGTGISYDYIPHHEPFMYYRQTANPMHLAPSSVSKIGHTDRANHQYDLMDFEDALHAGHLPAVTFLKAAAYQDGHAGYSSPLDEQTFLVHTINELMESPDWEHTAVVILYDDSDGWYDHQMGPIVHQSNAKNPVSGLPDDGLFGAGRTANCGTPAAGEFNGRCGYGPRQPFLVISPWAKQNFVDHNVTDQSSALRFIEDNWHLGRLGNQSSDAIAGSILNMFDFNENHHRAPRLILNETTGNP